MPKSFLERKLEGSDASLKSNNRKRSDKRESFLAKDLGGKTTVNSGATFGENDVETESLSIDDKTTVKSSYTITVDTFKKVKARTKADKMPVLTINFENDNLCLAVINYSDLKFMIELIKGLNEQ